MMALLLQQSLIVWTVLKLLMSFCFVRKSIMMTNDKIWASTTQLVLCQKQKRADKDIVLLGKAIMATLSITNNC